MARTASTATPRKPLNIRDQEFVYTIEVRLPAADPAPITGILEGIRQTEGVSGVALVRTRLQRTDDDDSGDEG